MEFVAVIFAEALHFLGALVVVGAVAGFAPEAGVGLDVDGDGAAVLAVGEAPVFARAPGETHGP